MVGGRGQASSDLGYCGGGGGGGGSVESGVTSVALWRRGAGGAVLLAAGRADGVVDVWRTRSP